VTIPGYSKGDQVRLSEKGRKAYYRSAGRIGAVVNNPQNPQAKWLHIRWNGNRYADQFHPVFIEKVET
jgi:hypothetical protein